VRHFEKRGQAAARAARRDRPLRRERRGARAHPTPVAQEKVEPETPRHVRIVSRRPFDWERDA